MSDPGTSLSILAAKLHIASGGAYTTLREALMDWSHCKERIRCCDNCGTYDDEENGYFVDPAVYRWWCGTCITSITAEEYEEQFRSPHPGVAAMDDLGRKLLGES